MGSRLAQTHRYPAFHFLSETYHQPSRTVYVHYNVHRVRRRDPANRALDYSFAPVPLPQPRPAALALSNHDDVIKRHYTFLFPLFFVSVMDFVDSMGQHHTSLQQTLPPSLLPIFHPSYIYLSHRQEPFTVSDIYIVFRLPLLCIYITLMGLFGQVMSHVMS